MSDDTIVALATPPGRGGVGIVRLSGPDAYRIGLQLSKKKQLTPNVARFSHFVDECGEVVDHGLILYFQAPHSFTGESVVEFQAHGSPVVLDRLIACCVKAGARMARPGEFSERAFLNDKIDLVQAEAIADLIQASSQSAARLALSSLQGAFSDCINQLSEKLITLRLYVEAAIDFPEEEIDFLGDGKIEAMLKSVLHELSHLRSQARQGALIREGLTVVIAGRPNAGKSTLINQLAGKDVSIVTDVAGTTRDVMREQVLLDDLPIHLVDTAGLRDSDDVVELEGIKRAWQAVNQADCVLWVIDVNQQAAHEELGESIQQQLPAGVPIIRVYNKVDASGISPHQEQLSVYISAKSGQGMALLTALIKQTVGYQPAEGHFLARRRHLVALESAEQYLLNGLAQLTTQRAGELLAEDLRLAHQSLAEITGEFTADDLLGKIFSSFCIGK